MTTPADDRAVEDAFEACLAGRPVRDDEAALASFAGAVRATATQPGRPNAALAELLATGRLADQPSPSTRTARSAGAPPSRGTRIRNRRRLAMFFPALLAKFLSAGAVAQAAARAGVALVAVTGAGAAGVLPDPLQETVAAAVETVTPFELPEGEEPSVEEPTVEELTGEEPTVGEPVVDEPAGEDEVADVVPAEQVVFDATAWVEGPDAYPSFGAWVSEGAHNKAALETAAALRGAEGLRFGQLVRTWARQKHVDIEDVTVDGVELEELIETTPTTAPEGAQGTVAPAQQTAGTEAGTRGNGKATGNGRGNGNGNGNGGGNAGKGNGRN